MSNVMRHRFGAKSPVLAEVASATVIEVGDLIKLASNYAVNFAAGGSSNASLVDSASKFLGVAMQASATGETNPIRVATTGVFEYPCASASAYLGHFAAINASALDQKVAVATSLSSLCVGYIMPNNVGGAAHGSGNATSVLVNINCRALHFSQQSISSADLM